MVMATVPSLTTKMGTVHTVPEPVGSPLLPAQPVPGSILMALLVRPVTSWLKVRRMPVLSAVPLTPPVCSAAKVICVGGCLPFRVPPVWLVRPITLPPTVTTPPDTVRSPATSPVTFTVPADTVRLPSSPP